jgi:hypothetical protein
MACEIFPLSITYGIVMTKLICVSIA